MPIKHFPFNFDEIVGNYCVERKIRYTRYADDMTFSGENIDVDAIIKLVKNELGNLQSDPILSLNENKIKIMSANQRQIVTGIVVNDKLQVPKFKRMKIRQEMFYIKTRGLSEHLAFTKNNKANYIPHLLGQVNFVLHINPNDTEFIKIQRCFKHLEIFLNGR